MNEHYWEYCEHCECDVVICGGCGLNQCSGGSNCDRCDEAYEIMIKGLKKNEQQH
jgi:hypothetical protein